MRFAQATAIAEKAAGLRAGRQPSRDVPVCDPRATGGRILSITGRNAVTRICDFTRYAKALKSVV